MRQSSYGTLQVVVAFTLLILPFVVSGLWWWAFFWVSILGIFAIFEIVSLIRTGKTLSQQFGKYRREHRKQGLFILGSMLLGWLVLLWHLWG